MIEITCLAEPLAPHRPPASRRASPCLRSPGATCLHVSRPAGQHHSGYAPDRLVARSTASIVNSRRLVSRKIGCGAAAALAGHAGIAHNHDGLGVAVSQSDKAEEGRGQKRKRESDDRECERSPSPPAMIVTVTRHVDAWRHALATPQLLVRASLHHGLRPVPSRKRRSIEFVHEAAA